MLLIRCAECNRKLWKYDKIGQGKILKCYKVRISKLYNVNQEKNRVRCLCGKDIGEDKGIYIKMIGRSFTYSGTKRNK